MKQALSCHVEHDQSKYVTHREKFLPEMDGIILWSDWQKKCARPIPQEIEVTHGGHRECDT